MARYFVGFLLVLSGGIDYLEVLIVERVGSVCFSAYFLMGE